MQTERVAVTLRPRDGWEAMDLGFRMARSWWRPLWGSWLLSVLPLAVLVHVLLYDHLLIAIAIVWWLKPLYDRVALAVLSEALFGDVPTARAALGRLLGARTGLAASLLWLRFSPLRALHLPVLQLERQTGRRRAARMRVLAGRESRLPIALHLACVHFELVLVFGLFQLLALFAPDDTNLWSLLFAGESWSGQLLLNAVYVIAMTVIEPFYVGGGFGFYINRRVYLEGWDIDLVFRKLNHRIREGRARPGAVLAGLVAAGLLGISPQAAAQDEADAPAPVSCAAERPEDAGPCIEEILAQPEFATARTVEFWWPRGLEEAAEEDETDSGFLFELARLVARAARVLSWLALAIVLVWLARYVLRTRLGDGADREDDADPPPPLFGFDARAGLLPSDVIGAARARWRDGDATGALSLLYRGALLHLTTAAGIELPASATEGECERVARRSAEPALAGDFAELLRAWQLCAYAQRPPSEDVFRGLCARWGEHMRAA